MEHRQIPGTPVFDGEAAQKGYALNKMCFSFNNAENRVEFLQTMRAPTARNSASHAAQRAAVEQRNVLEMIEAGGNVYYLAKLAGIFGLNVQDIGAQQTGMTVEAFKAKLQAAGRVSSWRASLAASARLTFRRSATRSRRGSSSEPYWKPFFEGFDGRAQMAGAGAAGRGDRDLQRPRPELFPRQTADIRGGRRQRVTSNADEGWGLPVSRPYPGDPALSWHLIESLVADEFDVTICQEMLVDHAFTIPLALLWPVPHSRPVRTVPIAINTVQHPLPSPARCFKFGQAIGRAIESFAEDAQVLVIGTGGLSHQLDGARAGFINKEFDLLCMDQLVRDPEALARYSSLQISRSGGVAGRGVVELDCNARRIERARRQGSRQLSHPHLQHRISPAGVAERKGGAQLPQGKLIRLDGGRRASGRQIRST